jgi:hypothetical protein
MISSSFRRRPESKGIDRIARSWTPVFTGGDGERAGAIAFDVEWIVIPAKAGIQRFE